MFSALLQTARGMLNSLICVAKFSDNFNSVFHIKKLDKLIDTVAVLHVKKKGIDWMFRVFTLNNKNHYTFPDFDTAPKIKNTGL